MPDWEKAMFLALALVLAGPSPGQVKGAHPPAVKLPKVPGVKVPTLTPAAGRVAKKGALSPMKSRRFFSLRRSLVRERRVRARLRILKRFMKSERLNLVQGEKILRMFKNQQARVQAYRTIRPRLVAKRSGAKGWWILDGSNLKPAQAQRFKALFHSPQAKSIVDFGGSQFKPAGLR